LAPLLTLKETGERDQVVVALIFFSGFEKLASISANRLRGGRWLPNPPLIGPLGDLPVSPPV